MSLAGEIALRRVAPRSVRRAHAAHDQASEVGLALQVCGSGKSATAYFAWLHVLAGDLIAGRWIYIERLARALLEHGTLTEASVRKAMGLSAP